MNPGSAGKLEARLSRIARITALLPVLIGCVVAVGGWAFDIAFLRTLIPNASSMKPNTAVGLMCAGGALLLWRGKQTNPRRWLAIACTAAVLLIGALTLSEYISGRALGIDELLFRDPESLGNAPPGRPSWVTASCFVLLSAALLLRLRRSMVVVSQCLMILPGLFALAGFIGFVYGIRNFPGIGFYSGIALHTSISFVLLSISALLSTGSAGVMRIPYSEAIGGRVARLWLPFAVVIPLLLGWLRWRGQVAGYYDTAFGVALLTTAIIVCFFVLIWLTGGRLNRLDIEKTRALRDLYESENRAATARAEERFRLSFEQAPVGMALIDRDGTWLRVNRSLCELTGYTEEELLKLNHRISHPDDIGETMQLVESLKSGQITSCVQKKRYLHKSGRILHVLVTVSAFGGDERGDVSGFVAHMVDITAREHAEEAQRESESRFRELVESAPDAAVIVNQNGQIMLVNSQTEKLFGYAREEIIGQKVEMLLPERYRGGHVIHRGAYASAPQARPMAAQRELYALRKNGEEFSAEIALSPLRMDGELWVSSSIRDITERKHIEAELESSRALAIETARLSALGQMSAGIAHEVNNPLAIISGLSRTLVRMADRGALNTEDVRRSAERITQTVDRIARIIKSLRHIARDDSREDFREVSVREIVEECLELCRERFRVHEIELICPEIDARWTIHSREAQIAQILLNLLQNAFDAAVDSRCGKWVRLDATIEENYLLLSVTDSGPGIPANIRLKIMEPFFTTKPVGKGTGLGLSISRSIAEAHGGSLELCDNSAPTKFVLKLPLTSIGRSE